MIKRDQYESIADCIRSDQVSAPEVAELFEDGKFLKWYSISCAIHFKILKNRSSAKRREHTKLR